MPLFYVNVWEKGKENQGAALWENSVVAIDVEEAFKIGKSQFEAEQPDLALKNVTVQASGYQVEK